MRTCCTARTTLGVIVLYLAVCPAIFAAASIADLAKTIKSVGDQGRGNAAAQSAVQELSVMDSSALVPLLRQFQGANPLAANWLRSAFEAIADRSIQTDGKLPAPQLEAFILELKQHPRARRLAYEWLAKMDPSIADRLIPQMLADPSPEFRRDAVQRLIDLGTRQIADDDKRAATESFRQALSGAVDDDQVKAIVKPLKKLGQMVDLQRHFGFLARWQIIGPFDNRELKGFATAYAPESKIELGQSLNGQLGKVSWQEIRTDDDYGTVDIAKQVKNYKGSVMYLTTDFVSDKAQELELRLGTPNAWKLWVNNRLLFARQEYHRGSALDQYRVPVAVKKGRNIILLKICQNEQTQDWAQRYQVQIRVCNSSGSGVLSASLKNDSK
ncbi:MAG: hypothetical protein ABGZ17_32200 [Planctomycetaceae bacterium]